MFAFLVTGIAVGVGLAVVTVGIPILVGGVIVASRWIAMGERRLVDALLGVGDRLAIPAAAARGGRWKR